MATVICCPCGHPLECEDVELVVTLACPKCGQELQLEFDDGQIHRCRAILTIMEGPIWVGERFVIPVGLDLNIGTALNNWMSLESEELAEVHCRVKLTPLGNFVVRDHESQQGTWVGDQRIARSKLSQGESFRVGQFRLRLDYVSSDARPVLAGPKAPIVTLPVLPPMAPVTAEESATEWLTQHRFLVVRWAVVAFGWSAGIAHYLHLWKGYHWPGLRAFTAGLVLWLVFRNLARRVSLARPQVSYSLVGALLGIGLLDVFVLPPVAPIGAIILAAAVALWAFAPALPSTTVTAAAFAGMAELLMLAACIQTIVEATR